MVERSNTLATVNGAKITKAQVNEWVDDAIVSEGAKDTPVLREAVLNRLIFRRAALQEIEKSGLLQDKHNAFKVQNAPQNAQIDLWFATYFKAHPITDADLKAQYDQQVVAMKEPKNAYQYQISQIVVPTQEEAIEILEQLNNKKGLSFESLAKSKSTDKDSGARGGLVGWLLISQAAAPIGEAIQSVSKGQVVAKPVQTQFGWHVIKVDDIKPVTIASFEQSKTNLAQVALQQRRQEAINALIKSSSVERMNQQ
jgi:peptidyl-prolyl cis-trans isomerase C